MQPSPPSLASVLRDGVETRVLAVRINTRAEEVIGITPLSPLAWAAICWVLWDVVSPARMAAWIVGMMIPDGIALTMALHVRRHPVHGDQANAWARRFFIVAALSGLAWGMAAGWLWPADSREHQMLLLLFLCGVSAVSVAADMTFRAAGIAFILVLWAPVLLRLLLSGDARDTTLAGLAMLFILVLLDAVVRVTRLYSRSLALQEQNAALLDATSHAYSRAEAASSAKTRFLAAVSHDLRQPVHAMALFLESLSRRLRPAADSDTPEHDALDGARGALRGMRDMLDSLLTVSRLEAGSLPFKEETVSLQDVFDGVEMQFLDRATARSLQLRVRPTKLYVRSDVVQLRRIVSNLVENAIRYTETGGVLVVARRRGASGVQVQIWDSGIGIAPEQQHAIFEEFYQVGNAERDRRQGLGLGLAIVRQLATSLGHSVEVRSRPGHGSVFTLSLTAAPRPVRRAADAKIPPAAGQGRRVLVIEDDADSRRAMAHFLGDAGFAVRTAEDTEEAVALLREGFRPGALLVDYRLRRGVTGAQAAADVCAAAGRKLPTLIVTGDTEPSRLKDVAATGYPILHKPVHPEALLRSMLALFDET